MRNTLLAATLALLFAVGAFAQQPDPGFYGIWNEDVSKSTYGNQSPPKMSQVVIGPSGWARGMVDAKGEFIVFGVVTGPNGSCSFIPWPLKCEQSYPGPRRINWKLKAEDVVIQSADIELMSGGTTMKATINMAMPGEPRYTVVAMFVKTA